jgi:hypothetical protein
MISSWCSSKAELSLISLQCRNEKWREGSQIVTLPVGTLSHLPFAQGRKLQKTITFKPEVKEEPSATPQRGAEIEKRLENAP